MKTSPLSPSDIAMLLVIRIMRETLLTFSETISVSTFIADNILASNCCRPFNDIQSFLKVLKPLLPISYDQFHDTMRISNVDALMDLFNVRKVFFVSDNQVLPNKAVVPTSFRRDSLVGLYVRTLSLKWTSLSFSSACTVFENYVHFCDGSSPMHSSRKFSQQRSYKIEGAISFVVAAEKAMQSHDTFSALNNIHHFFDELDLRSYSAGDAIANQVIRQQEAMLSLATMWIKNEQFSQAIIATEEGMRMAHQLGDHVSVARALLLLHHVVERLPENNGNSALTLSAESVLIRCIKRCTELRIRSFESQAILLLVRLRTKGPLQQLESKLHLSGGIYSVEEEYRHFKHSLAKLDSVIGAQFKSQVQPNALWALICSALLAESMYAHDNNSAGRNSLCDIQKSRTFCGNVLGMMELKAHACVVSADLWERLGLLSLSELSCKQALRMGSIFLLPEVVCYLAISLGNVRSKYCSNGAILSLPHILQQFVSKSSVDDSIQQIFMRSSQSERLLQISKEVIQKCEGSLFQSKVNESALSLVRLRKSLYSLDFLDKINLQSVLQMTHHSVSLSQWHSNNVFYYEILHLQCLLLCYFNKRLAFDCLDNLRDENSTSSCVRYGELLVLLAIGNLILEPKNVGDGLLNLLDLLAYSRNNYVPLCEASFSVLSNLLAFPCRDTQSS